MHVPALLLSALLAAALPPARAQANDAASPALVAHLLSQLEAREKPATGGLLGLASAPRPIGGFLESEQQLRRLGSRAASAAPRVAELLARTQNNASELGWTLWSIAPPPGDESTQSLWNAAQDGALPARLLALARVSHDESKAGLEKVEAASAWPDREARLLAAIALGKRTADDQADRAVARLAQMLKDDDKLVRQAALNGLRLQGARSASATPALIQHLRTRENVWMTTQVLESASMKELLSIRADLEDILGDTKLTALQKEPAVRLMMRIETELSKPAPPAPAPAKPPAPVVPTKNAA
jgi:hypothetical protein